MKRNIIILLSKILIIFVIFIAAYYLLILKPKLELPNKILAAQKELSLHHSTLVQNKLSLVELARLKPDSSNFNYNKTNLVGIIQETNRLGIEQANTATNVDLIKRLPDFYKNQNKILNKIFETDSFEAGMQVLHSEESVTLLLVQTQLIQEFEEQLFQLKELR